MNEFQTNDKRFWLGIILVSIGGLWLLDNLHVIPYFLTEYIFSWPMLLIVIGLYFILGRKKYEPGLIIMGIGTVFLMQDLGLFYIRNIWHILLPVLTIVIGISLIMRRSVLNSHYEHGEKKNDLDFVDDFAIFGGRERTIDSQTFRGGRTTAMFGGTVMDFRSAELARGVNVLDIFVMFGGAEIIVPPDWTVHVEVVSILGGFSDKRSAALKVVPNPEKVLVIKGFVMFGGGDVKLQK